MIVYAVVEEISGSDPPLADQLDVFIQREDAERYIDRVRAGDPELAESLRIEERSVDPGCEWSYSVAVVHERAESRDVRAEEPTPTVGRPAAGKSQVALARTMMEHASTPEEWVARHAHTVLLSDLGSYRFRNPEMEAWIRRWSGLMDRPELWAALREQHLDAPERKRIEAHIEEMNDPDYEL